MRAICYSAAGDTRVIVEREVPTPVPGPHQIRVRVRASALNRADVLQRRGRYPAPAGWPPDIAGLEYAGEVEALGTGVTRWSVGDGVMGLVGGGAQAEYVVVHEDEAIAVPEGLDLVAAAAVPEAFLTAWDALALQACLCKGERVLLHAVASGVGTAAVQLVRWLGGVSIGTSRQAAKLDAVRTLGLDEAICTAEQGFATQLRAPVDVIVDVLGGPALADNVASLRPRGRLVALGWLQGARGELNLDLVLRNRLHIAGSVMRSRTLPERIALARRFEDAVVPALAGPTPPLVPVIAARLPMAETAAAHHEMEADRNIGKLVLYW